MERCEERDASGNLVTQFFPLRYRTGGNSLYYTLEHLGSVREVTNSSGAIVAQVSYSPWGEPMLLLVSALPDFGYAGYFYHGRSGLILTLYMAYSGSLGSWLSRDPLSEEAGTNLYFYSMNNPIVFSDPLGLVPNKFLYNSVDEAAKAGFGENRNFVDASRQSQYEMGFWTYTDANGKYAYSNPFLSNNPKAITLKEANSHFPSWVCPSKKSAFGHTHPKSVRIGLTTSKDMKLLAWMT